MADVHRLLPALLQDQVPRLHPSYKPLCRPLLTMRRIGSLAELVFFHQHLSKAVAQHSLEFSRHRCVPLSVCCACTSLLFCVCCASCRTPDYEFVDKVLLSDFVEYSSATAPVVASAARPAAAASAAVAGARGSVVGTNGVGAAAAADASKKR